MSKQAIQQAIVNELRQSGRPLTVRELLDRIRQRDEFSQIPDFDLRSAVLAMTAVGELESTSTNQVAVRRDAAVAARG